MLPVNLLKLYDVFTQENTKLSNACLKSDSVSKSELKAHEIEGICKLIKTINQPDYALFEGFYTSFVLKRIGKEFDLLRIGEDDLVNIELKSYLNLEKAKQQLLKNEYYLKTLGKKMYLMTYDSNNQQLYQLQNNKMVPIDASNLTAILTKQTGIYKEDIHDLFEVSHFLVSPFNQTQQFLDNEYFLTIQQSTIKNDILEIVKTSNKSEVLMVTGDAGTGKTLLVYDIYKNVNNKKLLVHCGQLNQGHEQLIEHGYSIIEIKNYLEIEKKKPNIIFIDEAQRLYPSQLEWLYGYVHQNQAKLILSCDFKQIFMTDQTTNQKMMEDYLTRPRFKLSGKIRTNPNIVNFTKLLLDKRALNQNQHDFSGVDISFIKDEKRAIDYIQYLQSQDYVFINYSSHILPSAIEDLSDLNTHRILGQEYKNICLVLNDHFYYEENLLKAKQTSSSYDTIKMLYQMTTRAIDNISIIVLDNLPLFTSIMEIKQSRYTKK